MLYVDTNEQLKPIFDDLKEISVQQDAVITLSMSTDFHSGVHKVYADASKNWHAKWNQRWLAKGWLHLQRAYCYDTFHEINAMSCVM